eukprot:COSAG02_NODE_3869_length_6118_cov_7.423326_2_plen_80_part_00
MLCPYTVSLYCALTPIPYCVPILCPNSYAVSARTCFAQSCVLGRDRQTARRERDREREGGRVLGVSGRRCPMLCPYTVS